MRAIVYSQTTPSCCVMSLIPSHVSRSIQFRNVLLSLIFAFSSFLVKLTTPFDKIDLVYQSIEIRCFVIFDLIFWSLWKLKSSSQIIDGKVYVANDRFLKKAICFSCKLYGQITPIFLIYLKRVIFR